MNDYEFRYSRKENVARGIANTIVFAGGAGAMWLMLIGIDRLMGLLGML